MKVTPIRTRVFKEKESILAFLDFYFPKIKEDSIIVITSKIIALSEGRVVHNYTQKDKERIIVEESEFAMKTKITWLTIKDGVIMAAAGVDESNSDGALILMPKDSFKSATSVRKYLQKKHGLKNLGVLITDSRLMPLRAGVVGVAVGYAGFKGIKNYVGTPDMFGRNFTMSRTDIADGVATSAVLCMGEGREQQPLALIEGAPVEFSDKINKSELIIDPREDMYRPLFTNINKIK